MSAEGSATTRGSDCSLTKNCEATTDVSLHDVSNRDDNEWGHCERNFKKVLFQTIPFKFLGAEQNPTFDRSQDSRINTISIIKVPFTALMCIRSES